MKTTLPAPLAFASIITSTTAALALDLQVNASRADQPVLWWSFDQDAEHKVKDLVSGTEDPVEGYCKHVPGGAGSALKPDGFTASINRADTKGLRDRADAAGAYGTVMKSLVLILMMALSLPALAEDGWVDLFNGKNLDGWTQRNGTASYKIEGDTIVGTTAEGSPNSFLCTDAEYGDFELTFEVKVDDALNSGVQIRSQTHGGPKGRVNGPQVEIEASGKKGAEAGYIYGEAIGGWMTPKDKLVPHTHFKDGEWNAYRIVAKGPRIQVWINGEMISDLVDEAKFKSHPKGFIGLQVHSIGKGQGPFQVAWRKLKIKS